MSLAPSNENDRDAGVVEEICSYLTADPAQSFFLFAGAGSGKTRTLVEVLRRLTGVEEHAGGKKLAKSLFARGQSIRIITYTRNAVSVISGRLGENPLATVSTIHGFCWDLIAGFDEDIREALIHLNNQAIDEAEAEAAKRKKGPTEKDKEKIEKLIAKEELIRSTHYFTYSPDKNTFGEGALQHDQVLSITAWLLACRPTLQRALVDSHPIILIDESQDTMKKVLHALMLTVNEFPSDLALGFIGDHRQRIYMDGHKDLPSLIPKAWNRPKLEMNHRSQKRIVDLINNIWNTDFHGRTQPKTGIPQYSRTEKSGGTVRIFVGETAANDKEKIERELLCAKEMADASNHVGWIKLKTEVQTLALEHKLAAQRGKFLAAYSALNLIDEQASRPQASVSTTGPAAVQVILRELPAIEACMNTHGSVDEYAVIDILQKLGWLEGFPSSPLDQKARLSDWHKVVTSICETFSDPNATVRDVLSPLVTSNLIALNDQLIQAFNDQSSPETPEKSTTREEKVKLGWKKLMCALWAEVSRYRTYLDGQSALATHQVVKGSEFKNVMVIMDDKAAGGTQFSYDKLFGATSLTRSDHKNIEDGKETTVDRTLRLLYVTCSRAEESLALVLWSSNPEAALSQIRDSSWFFEDEIKEVPKTRTT